MTIQGHALTQSDVDADVSSAVSRLLATDGAVTSRALAQATGLSRQSAHAHLSRLVDDGELTRTGRGPATRYVALTRTLSFRIGATRESGVVLDEETVWRETEEIVDALFTLSRAARDRVHYAVTEMVNNAIDHASASRVDVTVSRASEGADGAADGGMQIVIVDDGIGAFARAREGLTLERDEDIIVEFSKGKRTTAPDRHSGEGLFFTSKVAIRFTLEANGLAWVVDNTLDDEGIAESDVVEGTRVTLTFDPRDERPLEEVFARFTIDHAFVRTRPRVRLLDYGPSLISRSQGKRLVARLTEFTEVELDFEGVRGVGQGFVDEVFRVWARAHPEVALIPVRMNAPVRFMIERGFTSAR